MAVLQRVVNDHEKGADAVETNFAAAVRDSFDDAVTTAAVSAYTDADADDDCVGGSFGEQGGAAAGASRAGALLAAEDTLSVAETICVADAFTLACVVPQRLRSPWAVAVFAELSASPNRRT